MIAVVLFTCDRPKERTKYARQTLQALSNLRASEPFHLHIADDGSDVYERLKLVDQAEGGMEGTFAAVTVSNSAGRGYGASYNLAMQTVHEKADLVLPLEDDWALTREFNLDPFAEALRFGMFGCIRMGYVGWTQPLIAKFVGHAGLTYLAFDPDSPEPHVFAGGPRLETTEFEKEVGPWPENLDAGTTEFEVAHRREARIGVAWPVDLIYPRGDLFAHIGSEKALVAENVEATA